MCRLPRARCLSLPRRSEPSVIASVSWHSSEAGLALLQAAGELLSARRRSPRVSVRVIPCSSNGGRLHVPRLRVSSSSRGISVANALVIRRRRQHHHPVPSTLDLLEWRAPVSSETIVRPPARCATEPAPPLVAWPARARSLEDGFVVGVAVATRIGVRTLVTRHERPAARRGCLRRCPRRLLVLRVRGVVPARVLPVVPDVRA